MQKVEGFDPDNGDWLYGVLSASGEVQRAGKLQSCIDCHTKHSKTDFIGLDPEDPQHENGHTH